MDLKQVTAEILGHCKTGTRLGLQNEWRASRQPMRFLPLILCRILSQCWGIWTMCFWIGCCLRMIPQDVLVRSRQRAAQCLDKGLGKKWYFALPILLRWGAGLALLVWLLV